MLWQIVKWPDGENIAYNWCYLVSKLNALQLLTWKQVSDNNYIWFLAHMQTLGNNPKYGKWKEYWTNDVLKWWEHIFWDTVKVSEISLLSASFFVNIFKKIPMVISIGVGEQFRLDREDWVLDDLVLDDEKKTGHATVIYWWYIYDSRRDQKRYSLTRKYLELVKWLMRYRTALVFKKYNEQINIHVKSYNILVKIQIQFHRCRS